MTFIYFTRLITIMATLKILAAGDFHSDASAAKRLAKQAVTENVDLIVLNGDIVEEAHAEGIVGHFADTKKKLLLIPGNHDLLITDFLATKYGAENLHGKHHITYNIGIIGAGGANCGMHALTDQEMYELLKTGFDKIKHLPTKIMVTHVHPSGTKMEQFSRFIVGSKGVRRAIEAFQPDLVICGHVHEAEGVEEKIGKTTVINVGRKGRILELDKLIHTTG